MNTVWADRHGVHDALTGPTDLANWLKEIDDNDHTPGVTRDDLLLARDLRDALRRLAALRTADIRPAAVSAIGDPAAAVEVVNRVAEGRASPRLELRADALALGPTPDSQPVTAALAGVAVEAMALLTDNVGPGLRACLAPGCVLYFVQDHPRREWCSNACGNRARAARHYERHRAPDRVTPPGRA
jgi:predicted RNA-binding Zn ribbon-like protein